LTHLIIGESKWQIIEIHKTFPKNKYSINCIGTLAYAILAALG